MDLDDFAIVRGEPVTAAAHVAFDADDRLAVDAFFTTAVQHGAGARGEPGIWTQYSDRYYAAFVNDLHGNNVEAVLQPGTDRGRTAAGRRTLIEGRADGPSPRPE